MLQSRGLLRPPFHSDDKWLFLVGPAVGHQCSRATAAVVPCEMGNIGRHEGDLTRLEYPSSLSFDLDRQISFDNKEDFLRVRMHVPGGPYARRHFQDVDYSLLNFLILALEIVAQDLSELRSALRSVG